MCSGPSSLPRPPFFAGNDCKPRNLRPKVKLLKTMREAGVVLDTFRYVFPSSRLLPALSTMVLLLCSHCLVPLLLSFLASTYFLLCPEWQPFVGDIFIASAPCGRHGLTVLLEEMLLEWLPQVKTGKDLE